MKKSTATTALLCAALIAAVVYIPSTLTSIIVNVYITGVFLLLLFGVAVVGFVRYASRKGKLNAHLSVVNKDKLTNVTPIPTNSFSKTASHCFFVGLGVAVAYALFFTQHYYAYFVHLATLLLSNYLLLSSRRIVKELKAAL